MVLANTYILTYVVLSSALSYNNVTCFGKLTAENFYAQSLAF